MSDHILITISFTLVLYLPFLYLWLLNFWGHLGSKAEGGRKIAGMGHNLKWVSSEHGQFISASSMVHMQSKSIFQMLLAENCSFFAFNPYSNPSFIYTCLLVSLHISPTQCRQFPQLCDSHYICNAKEFKLPNLMVIFKKIIKIEDYDLIAA